MTADGRTERTRPVHSVDGQKRPLRPLDLRHERRGHERRLLDDRGNANGTFRRHVEPPAPGWHTAAMAHYGLTGAFLAAPGKRDELVAHMLEAADLMAAVPGCLLYLVSTTEDPDEVAITELWTDEAAHEASLQAPGVGELIEKARPVIAGMSGRRVLTVLGGKGLPTA